VARILQLYKLQSLDSEIDQITRTLAEIAAQLGESDALTQARAEHEAAEAALRKAQTVMQDLDLELKSLTEKITGQERLLYSGRALSAKEAANLQDEVASLKRWQADREEKLLEAMVHTEECESALELARDKLAKIEADWKAGQRDLLDTRAELEAKLKGLQARRPAQAEKIAPADLDTYENLRRKKAGRAVAAVKNGVCQGCGMTPSNNKLRVARGGEEIVTCTICGRILYV